MLDSSCWLPTTSRDYDSNRKYISSHPIQITVCVPPWWRHRTKWPASYYCCYLTSMFTPYFRCLTPLNCTTVSQHRHGTVPATKSNRYGSVTREFHVQLCICLLYVVYGLIKCTWGCTVHVPMPAVRWLQMDFVRLELDISAYQLWRSSPETRTVIVATLRVSWYKIWCECAVSCDENKVAGLNWLIRLMNKCIWISRRLQ